ncbi:MAG: ABC transporter ATP-binding protein [Candidatus Heimdallarchaeota archaeon]|nr:ABC transporter ATP-binding protein [Candidatus Heimdallarchaeota archaeon]MBY8993670.1 ABC transporter ATP-binding protein [Candidatus Heimdallarchaeota archaeon]
MPKKAVQINRVTYKYRNSSVHALTNVSLDIYEGDFLLLVGFSGSGKSTLLKTINGLVPNFYAGSYGGDVTVYDEIITEINTAQLAEKVGFVFQNPENQLSSLTIEREIAFPLENFGVSREKMFNRIDEIITLLDIERIRFKSPFAISGGEQQLAAIAAALALDPPILILDEVTAHLSPKSANELLTKLYELNQEHNKTIIISEHRLDRCIHFANKMAYIENGKLKAFGTPQDVLENQNYPKELLPKIPSFYLTLKEETNDFSNLSKRYSFLSSRDSIPLTTNDFMTWLTKEVESK